MQITSQQLHSRKTGEVSDDRVKPNFRTLWHTASGAGERLSAIGSTSRMTGSRLDIVWIAYDKAYEEGFEDMPHRVNISKVSNLIGHRPAKTWAAS